MNLKINTPIFYFEFETHRWGFGIELVFERDAWWIINFSIGYKDLIILSRRRRCSQEVMELG